MNMVAVSMIQHIVQQKLQPLPELGPKNVARKMDNKGKVQTANSTEQKLDESDGNAVRRNALKWRQDGSITDKNAVYSDGWKNERQDAEASDVVRQNSNRGSKENSRKTLLSGKKDGEISIANPRQSECEIFSKIHESCREYINKTIVSEYGYSLKCAGCRAA